MPLLSGRPTPFTAVSMLMMFERKRIVLDTDTYDQCFDEIVSLLERCNDEKYRLEPVPEPPAKFTPEG